MRVNGARREFSCGFSVFIPVRSSIRGYFCDCSRSASNSLPRRQGAPAKLTSASIYPGTESWVTEGPRVASRDYRLYDIQHAVLPTRLPLTEFYDELVTTQRAFYSKHLGWRRVMNTAGVIAGHLMHGQTNFVTSLFHLDRVFRPEYLLADHALPVEYQMPRPAAAGQSPGRALYIHPPRGRKGRAIDSATERFVEETRMGITP